MSYSHRERRSITTKSRTIQGGFDHPGGTWHAKRLASHELCDRLVTFLKSPPLQAAGRGMISAIPEHGYLQLTCRSCDHAGLVAFPCKRRTETGRTQVWDTGLGSTATARGKPIRSPAPRMTSLLLGFALLRPIRIALARNTIKNPGSPDSFEVSRWARPETTTVGAQPVETSARARMLEGYYARRRSAQAATQDQRWFRGRC